MQPINYSIIQTKGSISQYSQKWDIDVELQPEERLDAVPDRNSNSSEGSDSGTNSVIFWWSLE